MKARTGSIVKRKPRRKGAKATWWARVTYVDPKTGKRHDLQRRGSNKAHARDLMQALLRDIDATDGQSPRHERKTLAELCDYFEKHYVKAAEYVEGHKVAGVRSLATAKGQLSVLRDYFGASQLRSITHGDVRSSGQRDWHKRPGPKGNGQSPALIANSQCCDACSMSHSAKDGFSETRLPQATL